MLGARPLLPCRRCCCQEASLALAQLMEHAWCVGQWLSAVCHTLVWQRCFQHRVVVALQQYTAAQLLVKLIAPLHCVHSHYGSR